MKLTHGKYNGCWFIWPSLIFYIGLGIELRWGKWYVGIDWSRRIEIKPQLLEYEPAQIEDKRE